MMPNNSDHTYIEKNKTTVILAIISVVICLIGTVSLPVIIAGLLACVVIAVWIPLTISKDNLSCKGIAAGMKKLSILGMPVCFVTALYADVGVALTIIFSLSTFMILLYISLTALIIRIPFVSEMRPYRLALSAIGYFAALFVPSVLLINSYNSCHPSYFCYERDQYLAGFDLGYIVLPFTLAVVVTFIIAPKLSKYGQLVSMGWTSIVYAAFCVLWLFSPRVPMAETDGQNPYYFKLVLGSESYAENAVKWLAFAAVATVLSWAVSLACCGIRKIRGTASTQK